MLQLNPISLREDYRKKWNIIQNDFVHLTINGELVNNTLYRVGGMVSKALPHRYPIITKLYRAY